MGMQNGTVTLEENLEISYRIKYILTMQSSNYASWYFPKGPENFCPPQNQHTDGYSNLIHNFQTWKQPRCPSVGEWVNKLCYLQTMEHSVVKQMSYQTIKRQGGSLKAYYIS